VLETGVKYVGQSVLVTRIPGSPEHHRPAAHLPGCPSARLEPNYVPKLVSAGDNFCVCAEKGPKMDACLRSWISELLRTGMARSRGRFPRCFGRSLGRHRISDVCFLSKSRDAKSTPRRRISCIRGQSSTAWIPQTLGGS
jgi:hypothetical protein